MQSTAGIWAYIRYKIDFFLKVFSTVIKTSSKVSSSPIYHKILLGGIHFTAIVKASNESTLLKPLIVDSVGHLKYCFSRHLTHNILVFIQTGNEILPSIIVASESMNWKAEKAENQL